MKLRSIIHSLLIIGILSSCNRAESPLSGTVSDHTGNPLNDIQVRLYPADAEFPESPVAVAGTKTDGTFAFKVRDSKAYLLEIYGNLGSGRVFVPAGNRGEKLNITYPVHEEIAILHTNDHHFHLNDIENFALKVEEVRLKYTDAFLFCAGDIFVRHPGRWIVDGEHMGGNEWYGSRSLQMVETMNALGYDLLTPGNHEFDYIENYTRKALDAADFPILAANFRITTDKLPSLAPYANFKTSTHRRISVLGLSTFNTHKEGVEILDTDETVKRYLNLRDSSDVFIALTHIGLQNDYKLARQYPEFDIIIGGHSHDLLMEAEMVNCVLVAHAGGNPHIVSSGNPTLLGKILITLENGVIREKKGWVSLIPTGDQSIQIKTQEELIPEYQ